MQDNPQFKIDALPNFVRHFRIHPFRTFVSEEFQIIVIAVVPFGPWKIRHDGVVVDGIIFHLLRDFEGIGQCFRNVAEHVVHFLLGLEKLLFGIGHVAGIVQFTAGIEANQTVVCFSVLFFDKVHVVGGHQLDAVFPGEFNQVDVHFHLPGVGILSSIGHGRFVALQFQVEIFAEHPLIKLNGLFSLLQPTISDEPGHFATEAGGQCNDAFMVFLQLLMIGTRHIIVAFGPSF